ncbi:Putative universal stress protein [archaeon HR05]|nr:Putative universal stress protein [archaeon HR05]
MEEKRDKRSKRIVVAIDTSDSAIHVIEKAAEVAEMVGADVVVLTVVEVPLVASEGEMNMARIASEEKRIAEYHKQLIDRYFAGSTDMLVESMILYGDAGDKICELAEKIHADLVVVGSRGLGRIESMLLGSVSEKVLRKCRCSVLVVKSSK